MLDPTHVHHFLTYRVALKVSHYQTLKNVLNRIKACH